MPEILFDIAFSCFFLFIVYVGYKWSKADKKIDKENRFKDFH